jgi:hypothetical protein
MGADRRGTRSKGRLNDDRVAGVVSSRTPCSASAQIASDAGELSTYRDLSAAGKIDARDSHGRTPLHVAAFMGQQDAARSLVRLGADPNALETQKYDIVTIASVTNDVPMLKVALAGGGSAANITSPYEDTTLIATARLGR